MFKYEYTFLNDGAGAVLVVGDWSRTPESIAMEYFFGA